MERGFIQENFGVNVSEATEEKIRKGILPVRFLSPGFNSTKSKYYSPSAVKEAAKIFEGAKMYSDHLSEEDKRKHPGVAEPRSVRNWVATLKNCRVSESGHAEGEAYINEGWLKEKAVALFEQGDLNKLGLSIMGIGKGAKASVEGQKTVMIEGMLSARSVDFVTEPGAGGMVLSEAMMENDIEVISKEQLKEKRADLYDEIKSEVEETLKTKGVDGMSEEVEKELKETKEQLETITKERDELKTKAEESAKAAAKAKAQDEIKSLVESAKLPELAGERIIKRFADAESTDGVDEVIKEEREYLQKLAEKGIVKNIGDSAPADKAEIEKARTELKESRKQRYLAEGKDEKTAEEMATTYVNGR